MLKYKMIPAFDVYELERALCEEYGSSFEERYDYELTNFLFGDEYNNDSFKRLYIDSINSGNETFDIIIQFLRERIPENTKYVLINVSW